MVGIFLIFGFHLRVNMETRIHSHCIQFSKILDTYESEFEKPNRLLCAISLKIWLLSQIHMLWDMHTIRSDAYSRYDVTSDREMLFTNRK